MDTGTVVQGKRNREGNRYGTDPEGRARVILSNSFRHNLFTNQTIEYHMYSEGRGNYVNAKIWQLKDPYKFSAKEIYPYDGRISHEFDPAGNHKVIGRREMWMTLPLTDHHPYASDREILFGDIEARGNVRFAYEHVPVEPTYDEIGRALELDSPRVSHDKFHSVVFYEQCGPPPVSVVLVSRDAAVQDLALEYLEDQMGGVRDILSDEDIHHLTAAILDADMRHDMRLHPYKEGIRFVGVEGLAAGGTQAVSEYTLENCIRCVDQAFGRNSEA